MAGDQYPERARQRSDPKVKLCQHGEVISRIRGNAEERDHAKQRTQHHDRHQHCVEQQKVGQVPYDDPYELHRFSSNLRLFRMNYAPSVCGIPPFRSDVGATLGLAAVSQSACTRLRYFAVRSDTASIAFAAFFNSFSISSRSMNVRRTSSASEEFRWRKSGPSVLIRSKTGLSTSRSRGSQCRVVRRTQTPSSCSYSTSGLWRP